MKSFRKYLFIINIFLLTTLSTGMVISNFGINYASNCFAKQESVEKCFCCSDKNEGCCCCNSEANEYNEHKCKCNIESQNENQEEAPINATVQNNITFELLFSIINNQNTGTIYSEEKANFYKTGINVSTAPPNLYLQNSNIRI